jgi:hypothetical protein
MARSVITVLFFGRLHEVPFHWCDGWKAEDAIATSQCLGRMLMSFSCTSDSILCSVKFELRDGNCYSLLSGSSQIMTFGSAS